MTEDRDPRDAFDAASIPGMRQRLASFYAEFRKAEEQINQERSSADAGGLFGAYVERVCPSCDVSPERARPLVGALGVKVVECPSCGFVYSKTVMDEAKDKDRYRASNIDDVTMKLRDADPYLFLEQERSLYYLNWISEISGEPGTLLEIGCGSGTFVIAAEKAGWQPTGVEPGRLAAAQARVRGARVIEGYFPEDLEDQEQRFDLIALLDVLEHVIEPRPLVRLIRERLAPGGLLFIQVPNWDSLLVQVEGARSTIVAPGHWSYFTAQTLKGLLVSEGFEPCKVETVVSELDRIQAHDPGTIASAWERLKPSVPLPKPLKVRDIYCNDLGYKLIGVFRKS